jgi:hypothetical protein
MGKRQLVAALGTALAVAACGGSDAPPPDKLMEELVWLDTIDWQPVEPIASPVELGVETEPVAAVAPTTVSPPAARRQATSRPASQRSAPSGTYRTPAPAPRTETVRNTGRDAAIGAGAGAVIGAVAGGKRHRVKGAIIGAATGAVVGGVIGHTVDKKERVVYP